jgi:hypothetical protein
MKIFTLRNPSAGDGDAVSDFLPVDGSRTGVAPRCSVCGEFLGMLPLLQPIRVEIEGWGSRWGDVAFGPGNQILVSEKLRMLFTEAGLVGFVRFDPVEIKKVKKRKVGVGNPPVYRLASIQRSQAALDERASGVVRDEEPMCEECRSGGILKRISRVVLVPNTWSGEDVFFARGLPGRILVSERFKRLCEEGDLANCCFIAAEEFGFDYYPQDHPEKKRH